MGHGVAGVDTKIKENLLELGGVARDRPEVVRAVHLKHDVLGKGIGDDFDRFPNQLLDVNK